MKRLAIILLSVIAVAVITLWSANIWRESVLIRSADLGLSRFEVRLEQQSHRSINFGADSRSAFLFRLPADYDDLANCEAKGYSSVQNIDVVEFDMEDARSCVKKVSLKSGTVYVFTVFSRQLYIKVLA